MEKSILIASILILITLGLTLGQLKLIPNKIVAATYCSLIVLALFFLLANFDKNLIYPSSLDRAINQHRQNYYPYRLGEVIHNNYSLGIFKYERNIFTNLSLNQYFFSGQPRLRAYALDFDKFYTFYLPFFLTGLIWLFLKENKQFTIFLTVQLLILGLVAFTDPVNNLGPLPLYPSLTSLIALGFYKYLKFSWNVLLRND